MAVEMTFSLDEETAARVRRASENQGKPVSEIVREAVAEYVERRGRLGEPERSRMLARFDALVPRIPERPVADVDREIEAVRRARGAGVRRSHGRATSR